MNVKSYLRRSNKTTLTDEELLLLDVLFDSEDTFESFVKENYASWHNLPYSHNFEAGDLRELVDRFLRNGILQSYPFSPGNRVFYGLSETGGMLWALERAPDWEHYCADTSTVDDHGNWILQVESPSATTATAFLACAKDCLLYEFDQSDVKATTLTAAKISTIDWRTFPTVTSLLVMTRPLQTTNRVDWNEYESRRTWWRSLMELNKFQMV